MEDLINLTTDELELIIEEANSILLMRSIREDLDNEERINKENGWY